MKIGVLLPQSTTHPTIGYDFLTAMKLAVEQHVGKSCNWATANIGFGVDTQLLVEKAEHLCLNEGVDVLVAFADHPRVQVIFPVVKALNKLLVVVNTGAKYPVSWDREDHVIYLTLNEWMFAHLTGARAAETGYSNGVMATNFYDGGYAMPHAIGESFVQGGGHIQYNFIGKHLPGEFDISPLLGFLETYESPLTILATFSGTLTNLFINALRGKTPEQLQLYGNPAMLTTEWEGIADKADAPPVMGYTAWSPTLDLPESQACLSAFQSSLGRDATAIGALGWDTGIVLAAIAAQEDTHGWKGADILPLLKQQPVAGTRGDLVLDEATHYYLAPAYWVDSQSPETITAQLAVNQVQQAWEQQVNNLTSPPQTGWFNTYLCS